MIALQDEEEEEEEGAFGPDEGHLSLPLSLAHSDGPSLFPG